MPATPKLYNGYLAAKPLLRPEIQPISKSGTSVNLSIPLAGIETASAAFDSAAQSITQAFNTGQPTNQINTNQSDSVDLSTAAAGLLSSKLAFLANEQVALVENSVTKSAISVLA